MTVAGSWLGASIDAFLIKIILEEELGYQTVLVSEETVEAPPGRHHQRQRFVSEI